MPEEPLYQGPIYVKKSPVHGYGVFAAADLAAEELLEECHTLFYSKTANALTNYVFCWPENKVALPLGFACIYNHSETPNVTYENDLDRNLIVFKTLRPIRKGEELFCSYGPHWFADRKLRPKASSRWRRLYRQCGLLLRAAAILSLILGSLNALHH